MSCDNWLEEEEEEEVEEEIEEEEEIEVFAETAQENGSRCSAAHECQVAWAHCDIHATVASGAPHPNLAVSRQGGFAQVTGGAGHSHLAIPGSQGAATPNMPCQTGNHCSDEQRGSGQITAHKHGNLEQHKALTLDCHQGNL